MNIVSKLVKEPRVHFEHDVTERTDSVYERRTGSVVKVYVE